MDTFIDIHGHVAPPPGGPPTLLCVAPEAAVRSLARGSFACTAIHPWDCASPDVDANFRLVAEAARSGSIQAIGETGVDRFRRDLPLDIQIWMFHRHATLSEETGLPLVIHSVRANSDILAMFARVRPRTTWIIHGFQASPGEVDQILSKGVMVSLGPRELARPGAQALLRRISLDRLFLESDDSCRPVEFAYGLAAALLECPLEELAARLFANWNRLFFGLRVRKTDSSSGERRPD